MHGRHPPDQERRLAIATKRAGSAKPIFYLQAADAFKLGAVGGHQDSAGGAGVGGNQEIVSSDWFSGRLQRRANAATFGIGRNIKGQDVDLGKQVLNRL